MDIREEFIKEKGYSYFNNTVLNEYAIWLENKITDDCQALQLQQTGVSGRSEQLIDFCKYVNKTMNCSFLEEMANEYINKINCH